MRPTTRRHFEWLLNYLEGVTTSAGAADKLVGGFTGAAFADFAAGVALRTDGFAADTVTILGATTGATDTLALAELTLAVARAATGAGAGAGDFALAVLVAETLVEVTA